MSAESYHGSCGSKVEGSYPVYTDNRHDKVAVLVAEIEHNEIRNPVMDDDGTMIHVFSFQGSICPHGQ